MTNPALEVRSLDRSSWSTLQGARLQALHESPDAFTSTYDRELAFGKSEWQRSFDSTIWVVARGRNGVIGMAGLETGLPRGARRHVHSVWVAPSARQQGVFRSLLERVVEIVGDDGDEALYVWVISNNGIARTAYLECGFVETGERQALGPANGLYETRLQLNLAR